MARTCRLTRGRWLLNRLMRVLFRLGLAPGMTCLLTVRGRRTGTVFGAGPEAPLAAGSHPGRRIGAEPT